MALIDELKERREAVANRLEDAYVSTGNLRAELDDLDRAIAALEPIEEPIAALNAAAAAIGNEQARAIAALEPIPDEQPELFNDEPVASATTIFGQHEAMREAGFEPVGNPDDDGPVQWRVKDEPQEIEASSQSELCVSSQGAETDLQPSPGGAEESPDQFEASAQPTCQGSEIASSPGMDEESRDQSQGEPDPAFEVTVLDDQTTAPVEEAPALNEAMQDEREQGYAPVTNPEADAWSAPVETTPGTLTEYVPPTNPDADFWARGITEQPKPEPFRLASIFRREKEDA